MKKLSIVGKDYHTEEHVVGYYTTCDRMSYWGKMGAFWGRLLGIAIRFRFLLDTWYWPITCCGSCGGLDRRCPRRCRCSGGGSAPLVLDFTVSAFQSTASCNTP
jgi:hypothetical protein